MRLLLPLALVLALVATLVACDGNGNGDGDGDATETPDATVIGDADGTPEPTPTIPADVCQPNPDPATPEFQVLDAPASGDSVSSPVTIRGQVLSFENNFQVAVYDADGDPITEMFGTAEGVEIGQIAPFTIDVPFEVDEATAACIWVYEASAMDGSPVHVGQIPVLLLP
jgi:hypothetical protein